MSNESQAREIIDSFPIKKSTVDDIEIEYKILKSKNINGSNENTPLLFIAGLRITMDMWPPKMLNELAQSNSSVIIYNNRGTGNSSTGTKDYSIYQLAKDAAGLLNSLNIEKAHVSGGQWVHISQRKWHSHIQIKLIVLFCMAQDLVETELFLQVRN